MSNCLTIIWQKLEDSFSAVLKPNFATKYLWKALDEIYQSCIPLRLSDLKNQQLFVTNFDDVFTIFQETSPTFCNVRGDFFWSLTKICRNFTDHPENREKNWKEFDLNLIWVGCGLNNVRQLGHKSVSTQSYTILNLHAIKHQTQ